MTKKIRNGITNNKNFVSKLSIFFSFYLYIIFSVIFNAYFTIYMCTKASTEENGRRFKNCWRFMFHHSILDCRFYVLYLLYNCIEILRSLFSFHPTLLTNIMKTLTGGCYLTTIEGFRIMYISLSSILPSPPLTSARFLPFWKSCHNYFDI